jgi:hypothetical protein
MRAEFVEIAAGHTRLIQVNVECRHAAMFLRPVGVREDDARVGHRGVGDPDLVAVDNIVLTVAPGGGFHRRHVRACIGFGDGEQTDRFAAQ